MNTENRATTEVNSKPDEAFIRRAIDQANLNVLRLALYQQTGDESLANMRVEEKALRGGALTGYVLSREHYDEIREKALNYLLGDGHVAAPQPDKNQARRLMSTFLDRELTDVEADFGYEELSFETFSRDAKWTAQPSAKKLGQFKVLIVGAGISGLAAAIQLERLGIPYQIVDKQKGLGGTWYLNDYPEARVDISTFIYQFKFEKNYPWPSHFATRDELKDYLEYIADKYDVRKNIALETEVTEATWNESDKRWNVHIRHADGTEEALSPNVMISCSGLFTTPNLPDIKGINDYKGKMVHTTAWDHDFSLEGKSVAVIGTGSTACQMVPGLAKMADNVTVFQRTPSWITPIQGYQSKVSAEKRWLFDTMPYYWNWFVFSTYVAEMPLQELQIVDKAWCKNGGVVNERNENFRKTLTSYIHSKFPDNPELAEKCIPKYPPLARRLVIDNGWYDTLNRDNIELVTDGISHISETGIVTNDGTEKEFDLIVLSAGFKVSKYLWPVKYKGRNGVTPEALWEKDGARAHLGMNMPGFPNFFVFYGPNGQARGGGFHSWAEIWSRYVGGLLVHMIENGHQELEVSQSSFDDYNQIMDEESKKLLWESEGVGGYYVNEKGRSGVNMPWTVHDFYNMVCEPNVDDFDWQ